MALGTIYPAQIDIVSSSPSATLPLIVDNITIVNAETFNSITGAILAIEQTLGVAPEGTYSTVRQRLDSLSALTSQPATGDLYGSYPNLTVIGLQGNSVAAIQPGNGQVLTWVSSGISGSWQPITLAAPPGTLPPSGPASGALSGDYPNPTIVLTDNGGISGVLPTANQANQTLILTGDVSGSGTTAGTATTLAIVNSNVGTFGDGTHVSQITVDSKGRITAASNVTITGAAPTGSAGGDLSGSYPNPTVSKLNGYAITPLADGYLYYSGTGMEWLSITLPTSLPPNGTAGGVLSGSYPNPTMSLTSNSSLTGILPTANQAAQSLTLTGDITSSGGTTSSASTILAKIAGTTLSISGLTSGQVLEYNGTDWVNATPATAGITQLTGDGTAGPGSGSQALTLATINSNTGSFGSATLIPEITVNGKGLITAVSTNTATVSAVSGITISGTPTTGQVLTATSGTAADWQSPASGSISALTGDVAASGSGSVIATLATVNSTIGTFGSATQVGCFMVNAKGLITDGYNTTISISNAEVASSANISVGKLAPGSSAQILISSGTPTTEWMNMTGDVTIGATGSTTVGRLQGGIILSGTPTAGQVLTATGEFGADWATPSTFSAGNDLSGSNTSQTVIGLQSTSLSATAPTAGQVLTGIVSYSGVIWGPATPTVGITALTGDVSASGSGSVAATVNSISGSSPVVITPSTLQWGASVATPTLTQASTTGTGANMTILAQSSSGTAGSLMLSAGSGGSGGNVVISGGTPNGQVQLNVNGTTQLACTQTGLAPAQTALTMNNSGTTTLSGATQITPAIVIASTGFDFTGSVTLDFGGAVGIYLLDVSMVTVNNNPFFVQNNGGGNQQLFSGSYKNGGYPAYLVWCPTSSTMHITPFTIE